MTRSFGRAVIIGIGGTGQSALIRIKKLFIDQCGQVPPCIRLLGFDTDANQVKTFDAAGRQVTLDQNEFCHLSVNLVSAAIENPRVKRWWIPYPKLDNINISDGAGGIREAARLSLFHNIQLVRHLISRAYNDVLRYGSDVEMERAGFNYLKMSPQVVVVGSLAGGTGSGIFVDISMLCRALGGAEFRYLAYLMMPWVYESVANTPYENTYAALLELDHQSRASKKRPFEVSYGQGYDYRLEECPYHVINLVDGRCADGARITKPGDLAQFIGESVFNLTGAVGEKAKSVADNIIAMKLAIDDAAWDGKGASAIYSTIGCSAICYPAKEIHSYYSLLAASSVLRTLAEEGRTTPAANANAGAPGKSLDALVTELRVRPDRDNLMQTLLPQANRERPQFDEEDFDLRDDGLRDAVRQSLQEAGRRDRLKRAQKCITENSEAIDKRFWPSLQKMFDDAQSDGGDGSRNSRLQEAAAVLSEGVSRLTDYAQQLESTLGEMRETEKRSVDAIGRNRSILGFGSSARKQVAQAFEKAGEMEASLAEQLATTEALALYQKWLERVTAAQRDSGASQGALSRQGSEWLLAAAELQAQASRVAAGQIRRQEALFEYYLGIGKDDKGEPAYEPWTHSAAPTPEALLERLRTLRPVLQDAETGKNVAFADAGSFREWPVESVVRAILGFVSKEMESILKCSVQKALGLREEMEPGAYSHIVGLALSNTRTLLPLKSHQHAVHAKLIRDFCVYGMGFIEADQAERERKELESRLPSSSPLQHMAATTQNPYRISFTRFFGIFPAFNIAGIEEMRALYNDRVRPPSHIDRNMLFCLEDLLAPDAEENRALKLLTLAMLDCFELIKHKPRQAGGGKYFEPDASLLHACLPSWDIEQRLPGTPGKFYSLADEIVRYPKLLDAIQAALVERIGQPEIWKSFFASVEMRMNDFDRIVDNVRNGVDQEFADVGARGEARSIKTVFNKINTGNLYRRQADFLRVIVQRRANLEAICPRGKDLVPLLLEHGKGFTI